MSQLRAAAHLANQRHISDVRGAEGCYHCWLGQYDLCEKHCKLLQKQSSVLVSPGFVDSKQSRGSGVTSPRGSQFLATVPQSPSHGGGASTAVMLDASQDYFLAQRAQQRLNTQFENEQRRVQSLDAATPFFTSVYNEMRSMYPNTQVHEQLRNDMRKDRAVPGSAAASTSSKSWYQTLQQTQKQVHRDLEVRNVVLGLQTDDESVSHHRTKSPGSSHHQQHTLRSLHAPQVYVPATYRQGEHPSNIHQPKFRSASAGASSRRSVTPSTSSTRHTDHTSSRLLEIRVTPYTVIRGSKALDTKHLQLLEGGETAGDRSEAGGGGGDSLYRQGAMWSGSFAKHGGFGDDKRSQELREARQRGRNAGLSQQTEQSSSVSGGRSVSRRTAARGQSPAMSRSVSGVNHHHNVRENKEREKNQFDAARVAGLRNAMEMPLPELFDEILYL